MSGQFVDEEWDALLDQMANRHVLPVIGPALVTIGNDEQRQPMYQALAGTLADKLGLAKPEERGFANTMEVGRLAASSGIPASRVWERLRSILKSNADPGPGLRALAAIDCFDLYISTTPDEQLTRALEEARQGFDASRQVFYFCDRGRASPHPAYPARARAELEKMQSWANCDLPSPLPGLALYQIMSSVHAPNAPVWEEDYMEYICSLLEKQSAVENLLMQLKSRDLLLIGAPAEDWIVRFLLRVARGKRLSEDAPNSRHRLAESRSASNQPMLFFFEKATRLITIIEGDPVKFAIELQQRWAARGSSGLSREDVFRKVGDRCPVGGVFISYAREDIDHVETVVRAFLTAGIPVWLDKRELESGGNYDRALEAEIKQACCLFVSIVSPTSEAAASRERYVHLERSWAAERHVDGYVFYLKLLVDLPEGHRVVNEPEAVNKVQWHRFEDLDGFVTRVRALVDDHQLGKRLRG